ncbi:MAG: hypothetical protein KDD10_16565 [Phaeodactylibacter sp.]|nr:hypothetical protein [Phaeodactylibacter sp.]MCB9291759.1 hypothetical protein [Lewinellaceae bacterium]
MLLTISAGHLAAQCGNYTLRVSEPENLDCYRVRVPVLFGPGSTLNACDMLIEGSISGGNAQIVALEAVDPNDFSSLNIGGGGLSFSLSNPGELETYSLTNRLFYVEVETEPGATFDFHITNSSFTLSSCGGTACEDIEVYYDGGSETLDGVGTPATCVGPDLQVRVDVANATFLSSTDDNGQRATIPVKLVNTSSGATTIQPFSRMDFEVTYDDAYGNLSIDRGSVNGEFSNSDIDVLTPGLIKAELIMGGQEELILASGEATLFDIVAEAPNFPPTGGEVDFAVGYTRFSYPDGSGGTECCAPSGAGGAVVLDEGPFPCAGVPQEDVFIELRAPQVGANGRITIPVHLSADGAQGYIYSVDELLLEIEIKAGGDTHLKAGEIQASEVGACPYSGGGQCSGGTGFPASGCLEVDEASSRIIYGFCDNETLLVGKLFDIVLDGTCGCSDILVRRAQWAMEGETLCNLEVRKGFSGELCTELGEGDVRYICEERGGLEGVKICTFTGEEGCNCNDTEGCMETDRQGAFSLAFLEDNTIEKIAACRKGDGEELCGVSTFDLVVASKHILGASPFKESWQYVAADVNGSGSVSTLDLIEIRKRILGIEVGFEVPAWRFIPCDYCFSEEDPLDSFEEECLELEQFRPCFKAIKTGDVTCDCDAGPPEREMDIYLESSLSLTPGNVIIGFKPDGFEGVAAFQLAVGYEHEALSFVAVLEPGLAGLGEDAYYHNPEAPGLVRFAWYDSTGIGQSLSPGQKLLSLEMEVLDDGGFSWEHIRPDSILAALAFSVDGTPLRVNLVPPTESRPGGGFGAQPPQAGVLAVTCRPNPFQQELHFEMAAPEAGAATLQVFHAGGALVFRREAYLEKGFNNLLAPEAAGWPEGIYYFTLQQNGLVASGKLVKQ